MTGHYRNGELFDWFISPVHVHSSAVVEMTFTDMDLETSYDVLRVFNDPPVNEKHIATITGSPDVLQIAIRPPIGLQFATDSSKTKRGFHMNYRVVSSRGKLR